MVRWTRDSGSVIMERSTHDPLFAIAIPATIWPRRLNYPALITFVGVRDGGKAQTDARFARGFLVDRRRGSWESRPPYRASRAGSRIDRQEKWLGCRSVSCTLRVRTIRSTSPERTFHLKIGLLHAWCARTKFSALRECACADVP
jgi:hypothetical protein